LNGKKVNGKDLFHMETNIKKVCSIRIFKNFFDRSSAIFD